jgi:putative transposase
MYFSGLPYHIVQRGNNREACFYEMEEYQYYLQLLEELSQRVKVHIHAFVLMTKNIHL